LLVAIERTDTGTHEFVGALGRRIEATENVHGGRPARAARSHDRDELASTDVEIDALQRRHGSIAGSIDLGHAAKADQRGWYGAEGCMAQEAVFAAVMT
jgi:hypothetical protein